MVKFITITEGGYINRLPKIQKPVILHRILNIRQEMNEVTVTRVAGIKWKDSMIV